jgi:AraC-like DNA-binding protein
MEIKLYRPTDLLLKPFIECFYTLKRTADEPPVKYVAFPAIYSMVCLNREASIEVRNADLTFSHEPRNPLESSLINDFNSAGQMTYTGEVDEIVIYFKPLAINAFLDAPLTTYARAFFTRFEPYADYKARMIEIFSVDNDEKRIESLEGYWRSKLKGFSHPFLQDVVDDLLRPDFRGSIANLAERHGVSRTTLVKHFDRFVGTTPSQFKKVARFREAMKRHRDKIHDQNLSEISYEAEYFDQSHMIKDFRSLTRLSPKAFFSKLSSLEGGQINWQFISNG